MITVKPSGSRTSLICMSKKSLLRWRVIGNDYSDRYIAQFSLQETHYPPTLAPRDKQINRKTKNQTKIESRFQYTFRNRSFELAFA